MALLAVGGLVCKFKAMREGPETNKLITGERYAVKLWLVDEAQDDNFYEKKNIFKIFKKQ